MSPSSWCRPLACTASLVVCLALGPLAQVAFEPARLRSGAPPVPPSPHIVGWGQEWLRVSIDATGDVSTIEPLREASSFSEGLRRAIREWRFGPARSNGEPVESDVLVAALFRPATAYGRPSVGQSLRVPRPRASVQVPIPISTVAPPYPPGGVGSGGVVIEVAVDRHGAVVGATRVASSGSGFDTAAVDTARRWRFQPAMQRGRPVASVAYVVLSFREPVVVAPVNR